jgi:hypothetical protein
MGKKCIFQSSTLLYQKENHMSILLNKILGQMAHNVPAVYDVWAGIKGLCEAKTARPNVPQ